MDGRLLVNGPVFALAAVEMQFAVGVYFCLD
jgi:hypothetical protein